MKLAPSKRLGPVEEGPISAGWGTTLMVLFLLVAAGCSGSSPDADPATALLAATRRTLAAKSFHIESVLTYDGTDHRGEVDYVAPSRFFMRGYGEGATISIVIGKDYYASDSEHLDRFTVSRSPCEFSVGEFIPVLTRVLDVTDVSFDGRTYTFEMEGEGDAEGEARIGNGYLTYLAVSSTPPRSDERGEERHAFSRYGEDIAIEPPPAVQVSAESGPEDFPDVIVVDEGSPSPCP